VIPRNSAEYSHLLAGPFNNKESVGARQMIYLSIDLVQTSCGYGVPLHDYIGERDTMDQWANAKGSAGIESYWREKNQFSIDGLPTRLLDEI
jgi:hypothetical protein